jgi:hypothetical protein
MPRPRIDERVLQIVSAFIIGIVTSGLIAKFQEQIAAFTGFQTILGSVLLIVLSILVLFTPELLVRLYPSPERLSAYTQQIIRWVIILSVHLFILLLSSGILFLIFSKLPTRENLPRYLIYIGPLMGFVGVSGLLLVKTSVYLASKRKIDFFSSSLIIAVVPFLLSVLTALFFATNERIETVKILLVFLLGDMSFSFVFGYTEGSFAAFFQMFNVLTQSPAKQKSKRKKA